MCVCGVGHFCRLSAVLVEHSTDKRRGVPFEMTSALFLASFLQQTALLEKKPPLAVYSLSDLIQRGSLNAFVGLFYSRNVAVEEKMNRRCFIS